jgi:hypothetical protein
VAGQIIEQGGSDVLKRERPPSPHARSSHWLQPATEQPFALTGHTRGCGR